MRKETFINAVMTSVLGAAIAFAGACWLQAGITYETEQGTVTVSTTPVIAFETGEQ